jgi:hypothetical protein
VDGVITRLLVISNALNIHNLTSTMYTSKRHTTMQAIQKQFFKGQFSEQLDWPWTLWTLTFVSDTWTKQSNTSKVRELTKKLSIKKEF